MLLTYSRHYKVEFGTSYMHVGPCIPKKFEKNRWPVSNNCILVLHKMVSKSHLNVPRSHINAPYGVLTTRFQVQSILKILSYARTHAMLYKTNIYRNFQEGKKIGQETLCQLLALTTWWHINFWPASSWKFSAGPCARVRAALYR